MMESESSLFKKLLLTVAIVANDIQCVTWLNFKSIWGSKVWFEA